MGGGGGGGPRLCYAQFFREVEARVGEGAMSRSIDETTTVRATERRDERRRSDLAQQLLPQHSTLCFWMRAARFLFFARVLRAYVALLGETKTTRYLKGALLFLCCLCGTPEACLSTRGGLPPPSPTLADTTAGAAPSPPTTEEVHARQKRRKGAVESTRGTEE